MLRALWFMIKIGILVAAAVWIAGLPGTVHIKWQDYAVDLHLGFFLACLFGLLLFSLILYRIVRAVADIPALLARRHDRAQRERGYRALTVSMSAVAAGDGRAAAQQALKARRLLKDEYGLPRLLEAQAARLEGREQDARDHFIKLLQDKDAAFLGVRGLLRTALEKDDQQEALRLAYQALDKHPKQGWILKIAYDLEIRARRMDKARDILKRAERVKAIPAGKARSDRVAMDIYEGDELRRQGFLPQAEAKLKDAHKQDRGSVPAATRLAEFYLRGGRRSQAVSVLEKIWKADAHPDIVALWARAKPANVPETDLKIMDWYERLIRLNPQGAEGHRAYGAMAIRHKLWAEARDHLLKSLELEAEARTCRMLADLESQSGGPADQVTAWLARAAEAPPGKAWICTQTGLVYERWEPFAEPHGAFNSMAWADRARIVVREAEALPSFRSPYRFLEAV